MYNVSGTQAINQLSSIDLDLFSPSFCVALAPCMSFPLIKNELPDCLRESAPTNSPDTVQLLLRTDPTIARPGHSHS